MLAMGICILVTVPVRNAIYHKKNLYLRTSGLYTASQRIEQSTDENYVLTSRSFNYVTQYAEVELALCACVRVLLMDL